MSLKLPTVAETLGAASIGFSVSCGLFGILTTQTFIYYRTFPNDKIGWKILVALIWLMELMDQIFVGYSVYHYSITFYGKVMVLFTEDIVWPLLAQVVVGNLVGTIVKCCFAYRVWRFSHRNLLITIPILVLILTQTGCAIAYCVRGFQLNKLLFAHRLRVVASVALGSGMMTDLGIALALCILLHRLRTGFSKSDSLINSLIIYAVNTGALTGLTSGMSLLVYNLFPNSFYFMTFYFQIGKLYGISLLCTLNTRQSVRGKGSDEQQPPPPTHGSSGHHRVWISSSASRNLPHQKQLSNHDHELKSLEIAVHKHVAYS